MTYVVTEACIRCRYTDCVDVCPVTCFHGGPNMLVINPEECIDCGACIPQCPVEAIYSEYDLSESCSEFKALNAKLAKQWPVITHREPPPPDADDWKDRKNKLSELKEE